MVPPFTRVNVYELLFCPNTKIETINIMTSSIYDYGWIYNCLRHSSCIVWIKIIVLKNWDDWNVGELLESTHAWFEILEGTWSSPGRVLEI